jgi:hypothetical protein
MTTLLLPEARLVDSNNNNIIGTTSSSRSSNAPTTVIAAVEATAADDFTVEDFKHFETIVHDELTKIVTTHKVTDQDIYLHLDVNVYKV